VINSVAGCLVLTIKAVRPPFCAVAMSMTDDRFSAMVIDGNGQAHYHRDDGFDHTHPFRDDQYGAPFGFLR
jgi:hypothetical protein